MHLSLSVNVHQSYRFKMSVKLFVDNLGFIRSIRFNQLAITDIRIGINSPNVVLLSFLFPISLHLSLRLIRRFGFSRCFLKHLLKDLGTTASAALAGFDCVFDDNLCFAQSFSF